MKNLLILAILAIPFTSYSQKIGFVPNEISLQTRHLHQINAITYYLGQENSALVAKHDFSLATSWQLNFSKKFGLNFGLGFNHSSHTKKNYVSSDVYYTEIFKGSSISYFNIKDIQQFNLEIPINVNYSIFKSEKNNLQVFSGFNTQILLHSKAKGNGLFGYKEGSFTFDNTADKLIAEPEMRYEKPFVNELYYNLGLSLTKKLRSEKAIIFKLNGEHGFKGRSNGMALAIAYCFRK